MSRQDDLETLGVLVECCDDRFLRCLIVIADAGAGASTAETLKLTPVPRAVAPSGSILEREYRKEK